jgi:undecaprenyl-diphosphatase
MESSLLFVIFMAIIQGITEFLPISSSGHLAILGRLFRFDAETNVTLNIVLHAGTLLAIIVYYFKELINILKRYDFDLIGKIIIATIPVGIIGVLVKTMAWDESIFNNLFIPGAGFLITAGILLWGQKSKGNKSLDKLSYKQSMLIGLIQAIAVFPGISRSGSTISAGLRSGLAKTDAAKFSFLLAMPAIGGVVFVKMFLLLKNSKPTLHSLDISYLAVGFVAAALVGYFSLALLLKLLKHGNFKFFAWYLYAAGLATLAWAVVDACC